ncbi:MAG TPA: hypothetical protein VFM60_02265 [Salinimicrobium sp.]|nr:hypothetical protein [Salinimicrobium sp.]
MKSKKSMKGLRMMIFCPDNANPDQEDADDYGICFIKRRRWEAALFAFGRESLPHSRDKSRPVYALTGCPIAYLRQELSVAYKSFVIVGFGNESPPAVFLGRCDSNPFTSDNFRNSI